MISGRARDTGQVLRERLPCAGRHRGVDQALELLEHGARTAGIFEAFDNARAVRAHRAQDRHFAAELVP